MKRLAASMLVLVVVSGVYASSYLGICPNGAGIRRPPWFDVVERTSKPGEICQKVFAPCVWVEKQWIVSENIGWAEGAWVSRDGRHSLEVRRVWGNTFELSSATGWVEGAVRATGKTPGCGPMVVSDDGVTLYQNSAKAMLSVSVEGERDLFVRP